MAGSLLSYTNPNISTTDITVSYLQNSALGNTFLGLAVAICLTILFASKDAKEDKMNIRLYVDCFINV
jgi:hypothetical protein